MARRRRRTIRREAQATQAVALRYDESVDQAPRLTAKGEGYVAEQILEVARQHGIPIQQDRNLVQVLSLLELDEEVPPLIYNAVAQILAFVYRTSGRQRPTPQKPAAP
ncbi:MAG: EscU/YscU/HrcU family type III secretion system export apparatus switch protein [Planctomycetes bacterium]|nr:EscU/YscU/HrcU family type III secretion system export apparatus switch protein [Planctomycetota bacterium]